MARRYAAIRERIARAARRAGRDADAVRVVAVTKYVGVDGVAAALAAGLRDFGENRVQDARPKVERFGREARWHFIGQLQTNKVRYLKDLYFLVHSVDRPRLAEALSNAAPPGRPQAVLLQVNVGREPQKGGVAPEELFDLLRFAAGLPGIRVEGLMAIPPAVADPEAARPYFRMLRELAERAREASGLPLPELSMGMSGDFEVAVEEGATIVRIGRALFVDP
ncbi:MAG: YggS family pyridoxal phosphate-dependent enzyme [Firmicutes bacterium]|nr:YggS family pyridoxal phosphate-dependent enzyme [Bacillota bacterium]